MAEGEVKVREMTPAQSLTRIGCFGVLGVLQTEEIAGKRIAGARPKSGGSLHRRSMALCQALRKHNPVPIRIVNDAHPHFIALDHRQDLDMEDV